MEAIAAFLQDGGRDAVAAIQNLLPRPTPPPVGPPVVNVQDVVEFFNGATDNERLILQRAVHPEEPQGLQFNDLLAAIRGMSHEQHLMLQGAVRQVSDYLGKKIYSCGDKNLSQGEKYSSNGGIFPSLREIFISLRRKKLSYKILNPP